VPRVIVDQSLFADLRRAAHTAEGVSHAPATPEPSRR
jgi:hypothetical protein